MYPRKATIAIFAALMVLSVAAGATIFTTHMAYADSTQIHHNNIGNHMTQTQTCSITVYNFCTQQIG